MTLDLDDERGSCVGHAIVRCSFFSRRIRGMVVVTGKEIISNGLRTWMKKNMIYTTSAREIVIILGGFTCKRREYRSPVCYMYNNNTI